MRHGLRIPALVAGTLALAAVALPGTASALPAVTPSSQLLEPAVLAGSGAGYSGGEMLVQEVRYKRRWRRNYPFWFYRRPFWPRYRYHAPRRRNFYYYYYNSPRRYYRYW